MIPWLAIAWLAGVAEADPATDVLRQRQLVDDAAAQVLAARADGSRKQEAEAMVRYRVAAAELERLQQATGTPVEEVRRAREAAIAELTEALAEGRRDSAARAVIATWLGEPGDRLVFLERAIEAVSQAPSDIRRGVLLDVVTQSDALAGWLLFDATGFEQTANQLELRARSLRRHGPAQTAPMADEVQAVRLDEQSLLAERRSEATEALRERALALRRRALVALEEEVER